MVEVLKENFEQYLPQLLEDVKKADFIAIDSSVETTGYVLADESCTLPKTLKQGSLWYKKVVEDQRKRSALEIGLAIFNKDAESDPTALKVKCYNVPILFAYVQEHDGRHEVRDERGALGDERLELDAYGFEFVQRINFDLNKTLYNGVPFMNRQRELEARDYMKKYPTFMHIEEPHLTNGKLDKYYFPNFIEKVDQDDIEVIIERLRGIGKLFDIIKESNVPVIGHNLLFTLLTLYKDLVEFLPPTTYKDFCEKLETVLPQFYDTKYMAWELCQRSDFSEQKKSMLQDKKLYEIFRNTGWIGQFSIQFKLDESTLLYSEDLEDLKTQEIEFDETSFCHESGFDALLSGIVFTKLAILGCGSFSVNGFEEYGKFWKNRPFLPKELEFKLEDDEKIL